MFAISARLTVVVVVVVVDAVCVVVFVLLPEQLQSSLAGMDFVVHVVVVVVIS